MKYLVIEVVNNVAREVAAYPTKAQAINHVRELSHIYNAPGEYLFVGTKTPTGYRRVYGGPRA